jgi:hypothetical protein
LFLFEKTKTLQVWQRRSLGNSLLLRELFLTGTQILGVYLEFLTKKTTFTNGLSKKTTCKKNCQKRPPLGGGMSSQLTRGTCRHCQSRHVLAAWDRAGMLSNMGHAA